MAELPELLNHLSCLQGRGNQSDVEFTDLARHTTEANKNGEPGTPNNKENCESAKTKSFSYQCVFCDRVLTSADSPKLLLCLHNACGKCVGDKLKEQSEFGCPVCKYKSTPDTVIDNQFLMEVRNFGCHSSQATELKCNSCDDLDNIATSWCVDCGEFICDNCVQAHRRFKITKDHVIKPKEESVQEGNISSTSSGAPTQHCAVHTNEKLSIFCEDCCQLTCRDCQLTQHRQHKYKFTGEIVQDARKNLTALLTDVRFNNDLLKGIGESIYREWNAVSARKKELAHEINDLLKRFIETIWMRGQVLVSKLTESCNQYKATLLEKQTSLVNLARMNDDALKFTKNVLESGSDAALLYSKKHMTNHLQNLISKRAEAPIVKQPIKIDLTLKEVPRLLNVITTIGELTVDGKFYASSSLYCHTPDPNHQLQANINQQQYQHTSLPLVSLPQNHVAKQHLQSVQIVSAQQQLSQQYHPQSSNLPQVTLPHYVPGPKQSQVRHLQSRSVQGASTSQHLQKQHYPPSNFPQAPPPYFANQLMQNLPDANSQNQVNARQHVQSAQAPRQQHLHPQNNLSPVVTPVNANSSSQGSPEMRVGINQHMQALLTKQQCSKQRYPQNNLSQITSPHTALTSQGVNSNSMQRRFQQANPSPRGQHFFPNVGVNNQQNFGSTVHEPLHTPNNLELLNLPKTPQRCQDQNCIYTTSRSANYQGLQTQNTQQSANLAQSSPEHQQLQQQHQQYRYRPIQACPIQHLQQQFRNTAQSQDIMWHTPQGNYPAENVRSKPDSRKGNQTTRKRRRSTLSTNDHLSTQKNINCLRNADIVSSTIPKTPSPDQNQSKDTSNIACTLPSIVSVSSIEGYQGNQHEINHDLIDSLVSDIIRTPIPNPNGPGNLRHQFVSSTISKTPSPNQNCSNNFENGTLTSSTIHTVGTEQTLSDKPQITASLSETSPKPNLQTKSHTIHQENVVVQQGIDPIQGRSPVAENRASTSPIVQKTTVSQQNGSNVRRTSGSVSSTSSKTFHPDGRLDSNNQGDKIDSNINLFQLPSLNENSPSNLRTVVSPLLDLLETFESDFGSNQNSSDHHKGTISASSSNPTTCVPNVNCSNNLENICIVSSTIPKTPSPIQNISTSTGFQISNISTPAKSPSESPTLQKYSSPNQNHSENIRTTPYVPPTVPKLIPDSQLHSNVQENISSVDTNLFQLPSLSENSPSDPSELVGTVKSNQNSCYDLTTASSASSPKTNSPIFKSKISKSIPRKTPSPSAIPKKSSGRNQDHLKNVPKTSNVDKKCSKQQKENSLDKYCHRVINELSILSAKDLDASLVARRDPKKKRNNTKTSSDIKNAPDKLPKQINTKCAVCLHSGELVSCEKCPKKFHQSCHIPTLTINKNDAWQCLLCMKINNICDTVAGGKQGAQLTMKHRKIAERIVLELCCRCKSSVPFKRLPEADNIDYYSKVKEPIALYTIRKKLNWSSSRCYTSLEILVRDLRLLFKNAYMYYAEDSRVYNDAKKLEKFLEEQLERWTPQYAYETFEFDFMPPSQKKYKRVADN